MTISETVLKLRNREVLNYFNKETREFTKIQLNKKEKFVCWERWTSKDKIYWINQNLYLSLKDVLSIRQEMIDNKNQSLSIVII
jgi:hypothetical protein